MYQVKATVRVTVGRDKTIGKAEHYRLVHKEQVTENGDVFCLL